MQSVVVFLLIAFNGLVGADVATGNAAGSDGSSSYGCDKSVMQSIDQRLEQLSSSQELLSAALDVLQSKKLSTEDTCKRSPIDVRANFYYPTGLPGNCTDAVKSGGRSGIYQIQIAGSKPFFIYCELDPDGGSAWAVFQRRRDGYEDFYRLWEDYKNGFGNMEGEFFLGLDKLHALTNSALHEIWIQMGDFENATRFAKYSTFGIGDATQAYAMTLLGIYSGNAGDSMAEQAGQKFTTKDVDNDRSERNCAQHFSGAWWYNNCHRSNLNGLYLKGSYAKDMFAKGINWFDWHGHYYSLKYAHMAIRPVERT